jgi:RNA polymerase sigma factor (sigma-70 family)
LGKLVCGGTFRGVSKSYTSVVGDPGGLIESGPDLPIDVGDLFSVHRVRLFRLARLLVGRDDTAEEIVQEAFLRYQSSRASPADPPAYLSTIVANLCRDSVSRRRLESVSGLSSSGFSVNPEIDETWTAVCQLPFRQRAVVALRYYEDLPEAEIARILDCRIGTVKSSLHRALAKLRKDLTP